MQNQTMCGESQIWEEEMCTGDGWNCGEKKNSIVTDVLVEAIFICGKTSSSINSIEMKVKIMLLNDSLFNKIYIILFNIELKY